MTCGGGVKWRNRTCVGPFYGGQECQGAQVDNTTCNSHNCPGAMCGYFVLCVFIDVCVAIGEVKCLQLVLHHVTVVH